jgi:hypothetical protein
MRLCRVLNKMVGGRGFRVSNYPAGDGSAAILRSMPANSRRVRCLGQAGRVFGWFKTVANFRKTRYRGRALTELATQLIATAYNLVHIANETETCTRPNQARRFRYLQRVELSMGNARPYLSVYGGNGRLFDERYRADRRTGERSGLLRL